LRVPLAMISPLLLFTLGLLLLSEYISRCPYP
jgi:hypothetical protein